MRLYVLQTPNAAGDWDVEALDFNGAVALTSRAVVELAEKKGRITTSNGITMAFVDVDVAEGARA